MEKLLDFRCQHLYLNVEKFNGKFTAEIDFSIWHFIGLSEIADTDIESLILVYPYIIWKVSGRWTTCCTGEI